MMVSLIRACILPCFLAMPLSLLSCSKDEKPPPGDTAAGRVHVAGDSTAKDNVLRLVVGGREPTGADSLREIDPQTYENWVVATHENIKMLCPPEYVHASTLPSMAESYHTVMVNDCRFLGIDTPSDTIVVLYYTGPGQAWDITGMNHAFYLGDTLHNWPPERFGTPMIKYLLPKWQSGEPKHRFLKHGLYTLLDHSGDNYHRLSLASFDSGGFDSLSALAVDPEVDSDFERRKSALAASFVDFVVYRYGIEKLTALYRSQEPFDQAVQEVIGVPVSSLQSEWTALLKQVVPAMEQESGEK